MISLFLEQTIQKDKPVHLTREQIRYLTTVMKCREGDSLVLTDPAETSYASIITKITPKEVCLVITEQYSRDTESHLGIVLVQGLLKGDKMDLVVQKATELGVVKIVPAITERSIVRDTRKIDRWRKIAEEASRQSRRTVIPVIEEPIDLKGAVKAGSESDEALIILWETNGSPYSAVLDQFRGKKQIRLCIGPEGGFSEKEVHFAADNGFCAASAGKRILRAETAAIAAITIAQYELGDLSGCR